ELLAWLRARLAAALDARSAPGLAADAVERCLRGSVMVRGRQRVAALVGRLHNRFAFPGWWLEQLQWPTETTAELVAQGPAGSRVGVRFTLNARGNRSQVGVDFQPTVSGDQRILKPVIDELVLLLRTTSSSAATVGSGANALQ